MEGNKDNSGGVCHVHQTSLNMTRGKAAAIVLGTACLILLLLMLRVLLGPSDCSTREGRLAFLSRLGWEVLAESEIHDSCQLPTELSDVFQAYNRMQRAQGYDLNRHLGEHCDIYTYTVTNYPESEQLVLATLYVQGRRVIAGDIHSTALDGFMHGLKRK